MTDEVIIDSSVWIHSLKSSAESVIHQRIIELILDDKVVTLPIIRMELLGGTRSVREFDRLNARLSGLKYLNLSRKIWEVATKWAFEIRRAGFTVPNGDLLIAAAAEVHDLNLIHADKHFDIIDKQFGLKSENLADIINTDA